MFCTNWSSLPLSFRAVAFLFQDAVQWANHQRKRGAQLMAHIGKKAGLEPFERLEFLGLLFDDGLVLPDFLGHVSATVFSNSLCRSFNCRVRIL